MEEHRTCDKTSTRYQRTDEDRSDDIREGGVDNRQTDDDR